MTRVASISRTRPPLALLTALLTAALAVAPVSGPDVRVVVTAQRAVADAAAAVTAVGGTILDQLPPFGVVVAEVAPHATDELLGDPRTAGLTPDLEMQVRSADHADDAVQPATASTNAPRAWDTADGEGVGVVVVDTGIGPHEDLGDRVVAAVDLTDDADGRDHYGHGTFMAGLVAGDGSSSDGRYAGVAPGAHLVSVKVAGADGGTNLSTVLKGLVVADRARELYDAPVVLLALSGQAGDVADPVMIAAEMLWSRGSTVVVAAGNDGPAAGSVGSPGVDPYVLTVGGTDDRGTADTSDDAVADWSSRGPTPWGHDKPEVVAPGRSTVSLRAPNSTIDTGHPAARVDDAYFKGTGTSMAAALTAGAAAVLLSVEPDLTPDEVKGRLIGSAAPVAGDGAGAGTIDVAAALVSDAGPANQDLAPLPSPAPPASRANGAAKGHDQGKANGAAGNHDERATAGGDAFAGWRWTGQDWAGWRWTQDGWSGWRWTDDYWAGWRWTGWRWTDASWSGWRWTGGEWAGWRWTGWRWTGWRWTADAWTGWRWTGWSWTGWSWL